MSLVALRPEEFTLVKFEAGRVRELFAEVARAVGFPDDVPVSIEVDEVLPSPISASLASVGADGAVELWFAGGCFEDPQRQGYLQEDLTRTELATALLRTSDRRDGRFDGAPEDLELTERQRAIWDANAEGRAGAAGFPTREPRRRYVYRLYGGFNDVAEQAFERLWTGPPLTWAELSEIDARLEAADTRPKPKRPRVAAKPTLRQPASS